jgi:hypothetical protein
MNHLCSSKRPAHGVLPCCHREQQSGDVGSAWPRSVRSLNTSLLGTDKPCEPSFGISMYQLYGRDGDP